MKKRDYSNPHSWQQPYDPTAPAKPQRRSKRPYVLAGAVLIVIVGFLSLHHSKGTEAKTTVAKKTGPDIQTVTLPIHQRAKKDSSSKNT